ncbi:Belongs to the iron ascorbate-dependent oxidoreductase, variant 2 [Dionaea muscipula]
MMELPINRNALEKDDHDPDHLHTLKVLPDSYAWAPLDHEYPYSINVDEELPTRFGSVPLIDLDDPNAQNLIGSACRTWGVFQVINHRIPTTKLDDMESATSKLFSLPRHQKLRAARASNTEAGYGPAPISSFFPKQMWSEGFTIFGSPLQHARLLWPHDYIQFCDKIEEYQKEMKILATKLMGLMLGSLGIAKQEVEWAGPECDFEEACSALQLNSYPTCPDPDRAMGLAAHTDSTMLTILYQNSTSGLQVLREGFGWVTVPPISGRLIINVGDLFHILSNGSYLSAVHRAMVNRTWHRLSIAYLYGPPRDVVVSPHPKVVDPGHPPLYKAVSWKEYLGIKAKHFDKALSTVKTCAPPTNVIDVHSHAKEQLC